MNTLLLRNAARASVLAMVSWVGAARGQLPVPPSSQFNIVGFLHNATLDNPADILSGGTAVVNGQKIIVPKNTIVEMPAAALTWQEVFAKAPAPYGVPGQPGVTATIPETGMSLDDTNGTPAPLVVHEFTVVGNRVGDQYLAALVYISQASLNSGQGYINFIDYAKGEMRVGGKMAPGGANIIADSLNPGVRVRINDPVITDSADPAFGLGRYSRGQSPDPRYQCDQDNPTIISVSGYPMGLPVSDPQVDDDLFRPNVNRPLNGNPAFPQDGTIPVGAPLSSFTMPAVPNAPATPLVGPITSPTPWLEAPFKVGDYIDFAGTLVQDGDPTRGPTTGPMPANGTEGTYLSAHTINNNVAIYTAPGTVPAYVFTEVLLIGTGGNQAIGAAEATARTRFEGFTTDVTFDPATGLSTDNIHLFGVDINPITGVTSDRDWGSIDVDPGPPTGAAKGRWRHRPPGKVLTHPAAGAYDPPTRTMTARISRGEVQEGATPQPQHFTLLPTVNTPNGLVSGQYNAPIFEYLFPEPVPGAPVVPINAEVMAFLALGIGPLVPDAPVSPSNPIVGQLSPWPGAIAPTPITAPTARVSTATASVDGGSTVTILNGSTSTDPNGLPLTYHWTQTGGPAVVLSANNSTTAANPSFVAPNTGLPVTLTFSLSVSDTYLSSPTPDPTVTITVTTPAAQPPIAVVGPNQTVNSGNVVTLDGSGSIDLNQRPLIYRWTQTAGPAVVLSQNNSTAASKPTFTAPNVAAATTIRFSLVVQDSGGPGLSSLPPAPTVTITVNPTADVITIASVVYRQGQQRLTVTATSSAGAAATLTLQAVPSLNVPATLMTPVLGVPTADIRGVKTPTATQLFVVKSSLGGQASSVVTLFR
jgi:hypothetical protein